MTKNPSMTNPKIMNGAYEGAVGPANPEVTFSNCRWPGLEELVDADGERDRRVLDDVDEQPDHRR